MLGLLHAGVVAETVVLHTAGVAVTVVLHTAVGSNDKIRTKLLKICLGLNI